MGKEWMWKFWSSLQGHLFVSDFLFCVVWIRDNKFGTNWGKEISCDYWRHLLVEICNCSSTSGTYKEKPPYLWRFCPILFTLKVACAMEADSCQYLFNTSMRLSQSFTWVCHNDENEILHQIQKLFWNENNDKNSYNANFSDTRNEFKILSFSLFWMKLRCQKVQRVF